MSAIGKIKIRNLAELMCEPPKEPAKVSNTNLCTNDIIKPTNEIINLVDDDYDDDDCGKEILITPAKKKGTKRKVSRKEAAAATTTKVIKTSPQKDNTRNKNSKSTIKKKQELDPNQPCINTIFKSCSKSFRVVTTLAADKKNDEIKIENNKRRKLFNETPVKKRVTRSSAKKINNLAESLDFIDLCSSNSEDNNEENSAKKLESNKPKNNCNNNNNITNKNEKKTNLNEKDLFQAENVTKKSLSPSKNNSVANSTITDKQKFESSSKVTINNVEKKTLPNEETLSNFDAKSELGDDIIVPVKKIKKPRPCPPYKIVRDTTFAVDAFQFGLIEGVTHYFLTHFHSDHYIGLNGKFAMPLFLSSITAKLVRAFIPIDEQYLNVMDLNVPIKIDDIEITAIDANHCPGAVMFVFKLKSGSCILHTGDFRASADMESEPIFWNNDINIIYLDTTYISKNYAFCHQSESIEKAIEVVKNFQVKCDHQLTRILYVCGSYVIGKEKMWSSLAREFNLKVWTEKNRRKALNAMAILEYLQLLCDDPFNANMHIIAMGKLSYPALMEYFEPFKSHFDVLLAIRPSGWEKNSKPQYRGLINIVGIEYSEHSSYEEMQRFVKYLKPKEVISTVPVRQDLMITAKIPEKWYKYDKLRANYQPSITNYFKLKSASKLNEIQNLNKSISPTRSNVSGIVAESNSPMKYLPIKSECTTECVSFDKAAAADNGDFDKFVTIIESRINENGYDEVTENKKPNKKYAIQTKQIMPKENVADNKDVPINLKWENI